MLELIVFIVASIIYFAARYFLDPSYFRLIIGVYVTVVLISQFYFNVALLSEMCGGNTSNLKMAIMVTLIPWIVLGGGVTLGLLIFPGWKQPFSNTFGYLVAKLAGVDSILYKILKSPTTGGAKLKKTLHDIYSNPALFINQITPGNFDDFVKASQFMFAPNVPRNEMKKFRKIIELKDLVSEFVWYTLTGILVTTVSYNTIVNSTCNNSVKEMKKRHDEYEIEVAEKRKKEAKAPPKKIYKIYD
jgi:hypothetical protein